MRKLMPHQAEALAYARTRSSIALFHEMRLGKTLVAIRWALQQSAHRQGRVLVVAPLSVLPTWQHELALEGQKSLLIRGSHRARTSLAKHPEIRFFLINYEALRVTPALATLPWDVLILDESTKIRNPQAKITRFLIKEFSHVPAKAILSGLPAPESPLDYCTQFLFLYPSFMQCYNYWQFRNRYFRLIGYDWVLKPFFMSYLKEQVHGLSHILSRKALGIGSPKVYEKRYVKMEPEQRRLYAKVEKEFAYDIKGKEITTIWNPVKLVWMARLAGGYTPDKRHLSFAKAKEIYELLTGELKNEKVLIWFRFNEELRFVTAYLNAKGIWSGPITGETTPETRATYVDMFKKNVECRVLCLQIKCLKYGVDLSASSTAIYYSNSYEMEDRAQSEDRIVHPMKKEPLLYIDLITEDTVDEEVVEILQQKKITSKFFLMELVKKWRERNEAHDN